MKVSTAMHHEIINAEQDGEKYLATHHSQTTYHFICETPNDKDKVEAFILLCFLPKKVKK